MTFQEKVDSFSFAEHVSALEYMGEENPNIKAWQEGPAIGVLRSEYVKAHKAHAKSLESGDSDAIKTAWETYCRAQEAFTLAYYADTFPE